jgi:hypothetical protein
MVRTELATIVERRGEGDLDPEQKAARPYRRGDPGDRLRDGDGDLDPAETQGSGGDDDPSSREAGVLGGGRGTGKADRRRSGDWTSSAASSADQSMGGGWRTPLYLGRGKGEREAEGFLGLGNFGRCGFELKRRFEALGGIKKDWG